MSRAEKSSREDSLSIGKLSFYCPPREAVDELLAQKESTGRRIVNGSSVHSRGPLDVDPQSHGPLRRHS